MDFGKLLRITGFLLIGKGLLEFISLIGIMYGYAERGVIDNFSGLFLFSIIFYTATMILGIYFAELGGVETKKPGEKRIITLRKEIPRGRVLIFLGIEFLGAVFILMNIPELPRLWVVLGAEFITLVYGLMGLG